MNKQELPKNTAKKDSAHLFPEVLLVQEVDRSFNMKPAIEAKGANYMVIVTLILNILVTFMKKLEDISQFPILKMICFLIFIITFCIGIAFLFTFAFMQKPRKTASLSDRTLLELYNDEKKSPSEKEIEIIKDCEQCIPINDKTTSTITLYNKVMFKGLLILMAFFALSCILFFLATGVSL